MWSESITCPQRSTWLSYIMTQIRDLQNDARCSADFHPWNQTQDAQSVWRQWKGAPLVWSFMVVVSLTRERLFEVRRRCSDEISVKWKDAAAFSTADWIVSSSAEGDAHHSAWRDSTKHEQSDTSWIGSNRAQRRPQCSWWSRVYSNMLVRKLQWMQRLTLPGEKDGLSPQNSSEFIWIKNYYFYFF